jgi:hypothetical protein
MIMNYIDLNTRRGFVNLLADYIVKEFGESTVIEVVDCESFLVIKGVTPKREVLDLSTIRDNFFKENPTYKKYSTNFIDIIQYDKQYVSKPRWFSYYPTDRSIYDQKVIEQLSNPNKDSESFEYGLTITSEFPHGYGLECGRFEYYFGEYVSNHIFNITNSDKIDICYDTNELLVENWMVKLKMENSLLSEKYIVSMLLDVFYTDKNLRYIKNIIRSNYDILEDLHQPMTIKPWLIKNKIEDVVVV